MLKSKYKWEKLSTDEIKTPDELRNCLVKNRQIENPLFFSPEFQFYDPYLFQEMKKVVTRVLEAIEKKEKIFLYGDYDVDGVTGTAILYRTISSMGGIVEFYIPNRFTEGYGPNLSAFQSLVKQGAQLIISIDNGITGIEEAQFLKKQGIDFIITDHHESKAELPIAFAIIHPHLEEHYPFHDLSGSGVAFKVATALLDRVPYEYMDLASLGTYADLVPLKDENRAIVEYGLNILKQTKIKGLQALLESSGSKRIDEETLGFVLGPRLNAPGRMGEGSLAVQLLVTESYEMAVEYSVAIENANHERKGKIESTMNEARVLIQNNHYDDQSVLIVCKADWHEGIIGIIANKLVDEFNKPVIVFTESEGVYKGSARTLPGFPLFTNLEKCQDLLLRFGGHKMAAGLSLEKHQLEPLRLRIQTLLQEDLYNTAEIDGELHVSLINQAIFTHLSPFKPFGMGNQKPLFLFSNYEVISIAQMGNQQHLRLTLKKDDLTVNGVYFHKGSLMNELSVHHLVDVIATLEINEYNGRTTLQLMIKDLQCNHLQFIDCRGKAFEAQLSLQYLYFNHHYGYNNAKRYDKDLVMEDKIVLIDLPDSIDSLQSICSQKHISQVYLLFKEDQLFSEEHLLTREKMGKIYTIFKQLKRFTTDQENVYFEMNRIGIHKKVVLLVIQVFFELNFVIIEGNTIIVIEDPVKRPLTDSMTYQNLLNQIEMHDKLLLSSTKELLTYIKELTGGNL